MSPALQEARSGVGRLGAVDAVELGRVADRLVHLHLHLLRVDHGGRHLRRALVGAEQRGRLLGDARRLAFEAEALDVLPARLRAGADVGARVGADLDEPLADRDRLDEAAALDELLLDLDPVGGEEQLLLALRPDRGLRHLDVGMAKRLLGAQAERDLLVDRDVERVALHRRAVRPRARVDRGEGAVRRPAGRRRESVGAERGVARALGREPPVGGEPPGAADEHADADPFRLAVGERVDPPVLRADVLRAAHDRPCVGVARPGAERRVDCRCTGFTHRSRTLPMKQNAATFSAKAPAKPAPSLSFASVEPTAIAASTRMRWRGLEPPRPKGPQGPQPCASTNSATSARRPF